MRRKVTLKEAISVVKLSLFLVYCWPVSHDATRFKMFCVKLYHCLCISVAVSLDAAIIYGITNNLNNSVVLVNQILILSSVTHAAANFTFHMINYHHIQNIIFKMIHFCDLMKPHEEVVIQRYIDKCVTYYSISIFIIYLTVIVTVTIMPSLTHSPFPTYAEYPFDVSVQPLKTIIYVQQSMSAFLVGGQLCVNVLMALLLWFASARFEILAEELRKVTNVYQLFKYIKKHQELLEYAREVTITASPFAFTTVCCSTISLTVILLLFISHQPVAILAQFCGLGLTCISEVFSYTWPAEHLMYTSKDLAQAAFDVVGNNHLIKIWKNLQIIMMRSQKPITVSLPCFLPALTLNYFTSYLSTILSYFTTLRVIMNDD